MTVNGPPLTRLNNSQQVTAHVVRWLLARGHRTAASDLARNWRDETVWYDAPLYSPAREG